MAQLREIKKRIRSVGKIQRITKTMQMIATAKFQAAIRRAEATKPFTAKLSEVVSELAAAAGDGADHPLLNPPAERRNRELLLVVTSNRGYAGAYNSNVLRTALSYIRQHRDRQIDLEVVGKKGIGFFRFAGLEVSKPYTHFTDKPSYEEVEKVATDYIARFEAGEYDAVRVMYMQFISNARQSPRTVQLLPMPRPEAGTQGSGSSGTRSVYEFSPGPQELLGQLLPLTVKSMLFQAFTDAIVSEQIARMVAMKAATDNAGKMGRSLRRSFNRARQALITTQLSEIISGAAALS